MIEITIKEKEDESGVHMEVEGKPQSFLQPLAMLMEAQIDYLQQTLGMSRQEALIRHFLTLAKYMEGCGYPKDNLHRLVDYDLESAAKSMKH